jgi:hypothetical protein
VKPDRFGDRHRRIVCEVRRDLERDPSSGGARRDTVEAAWRIVELVLDGAVAACQYRPGTWCIPPGGATRARRGIATILQSYPRHGHKQ